MEQKAIFKKTFPKWGTGVPGVYRFKWYYLFQEKKNQEREVLVKLLDFS